MNISQRNLNKLIAYRKIHSRVHNTSSLTPAKKKVSQLSVLHRYERQLKQAGLAAFLSVGMLSGNSELSGQCGPLTDQFTVDNSPNITTSDVAKAPDGSFVTVVNKGLVGGDQVAVVTKIFDNAGMAISGDFIVNTYTTGAQLGGKIAMDQSGNFVVAWASYGQDGGGFGIYAQRFTNVGGLVGSEFRVNDYVTGNQNAEAIALDADGNFVITWQSNGQIGNGQEIYAKRYNNLGVAQGSEFLVNSYITGNQESPKVAMDQDGDFVITWQSDGQDGSSYGIYAQRYNSLGVTQGSEFLVNSYTTGIQQNPDIGTDAAGNFIIAWEADSPEYGIYAQRYNNMGTAIGSNFRVNAHTDFYQSQPAIAVGENGDFVIVWSGRTPTYTDGGEIFAQRFTPQGIKLGDEFLVNTSTVQYQEAAAVSMDPTGDFVITWWDAYFTNNNGQLDETYAVYGRVYGACAPPSISGRDTTVCEGDDVDLATLLNEEAQGVLSFGDVYGQWDGSQIVSPVQRDTFYVRDSVAFLSLSDTARIIVTVVPNPSISGRDTTICVGDLIDLANFINESPVGTLSFGTIFGQWNGPQMVSPAQTTTYFVRDSLLAPDKIDTAQVIINVLQFPSISGRDTTICVGESVDLLNFVNGPTIGTLSYAQIYGVWDGSQIVMPSQTTAYYVRDSLMAPDKIDTAIIVINVLQDPLITGRDTMICAGEIIDLSNFVTGPVIGTLSFGTVYEQWNGSQVVSPMNTTTYFVRDSVLGPDKIDTAMVTLTVRNDMSCLMNFSSTNFIKFLDPCDCDNIITINEDAYFRDTLQIDFNAGQNITFVAAGSSDFYDENGNLIADGTLFVETSPGVYHLEFYKLEGVQPIAYVSLNGGDPIPVDPNALEVCLLADCPAPIPTLGQWGLMILGFFFVILGIVGIKRRARVGYRLR